MLRIFVASTAALVLMSSAAPPRDTLLVVGVAIRKGTQQRVAGAAVKLVADATGVGLLASDRTSDNGVFNLMTRNIGGPIGDLFVIYDGDAADVTPLKVKLPAPADGVIDARPGDLVFQYLPATPTLTEGEATEHLTAALETQAVLLHAGLIKQDAFDKAGTARLAAIKQKVNPVAVSKFDLMQHRAIDSAIKIEPNIDKSVMSSRMGGRGGS